jgi:hypothetical protein
VVIDSGKLSLGSPRSENGSADSSSVDDTKEKISGKSNGLRREVEALLRLCPVCAGIGLNRQGIDTNCPI